jgi:glycosyltransferase involved in cell wall biosynthesis
MKIALFVPSWPPGFAANGIVTYASQLVPALRRLGHEVFVLTFAKGAIDDDPHTIDLRSFASAPTLWRRAMFKLAPDTAAFNAASLAIASAINDLVKKHKPDVFEMEESFGWSFAISRMNLLPVVVRLHGPWFLNGRFNDPHDVASSKRYREEWEGRALQHAHFVTAPSAQVLRTVKSHYRLDLTESRVIPNPVDTASRTELWNIETCCKNSLLFVGRFDSRKGGDLVLSTFAELAATYPALTLTFVGPDRGIKYDDKVLSFDEFVRSKLPERCRRQIMFHGQMSQLNVTSLRAKHFITIVASQYEILPYSVLEPMSLACPLIATAVGGIPELIRHQQNGLLVPTQNIKAMAAACQSLLNDQALAVRLGRQAWRDCQDFYGPDNIAMQTVEAYQEAINRFKFRNAG